MKQELKENTGLPSSLLWILAIIAGISVANLYYNQPLLNLISHDLKVSEFSANLIAMTTQIGYALGLLFIIPLGDLYKRKQLFSSISRYWSCHYSPLPQPRISISFACFTTDRYMLCDASDFCSHCRTILYSWNQRKNVGMIISGLLTGILASRVVSGIAGEYMGWRFIFYVAAVLMVVCVIIIMRILPDIPSNFRGKYSDLMKSLLSLVTDYPQLRISSLRAGIAFGSFWLYGVHWLSRWSKPLSLPATM